MVKKIAVISFFLFICKTYSQEKAIKAFGDVLTESILSQDSLKFRSLTLPKNAFIEMFNSQVAPTLTKEDRDIAIKNINENYDELILLAYNIVFFNLTNKASIFNLDLKNLDYKIIETEKINKNLSFISVQAAIDHKIYKYLSFYVTKYQDKFYLASELINISEVNKFEERKGIKRIEFSEDENGNLVMQDKISLIKSSASKIDILDCILNSTFSVIGVEETSEGVDKEELKYEYIKGSWEYNYYLDEDLNIPIGKIAFKYELKIADGYIDYSYYDFTHFKEDSEFKTIGKLPFKVNKSVLETFTEEQYKTILDEIYLNLILGINRIRKNTNICLEQ